MLETEVVIVVVDTDECIISDGYNPLPRVTIYASEGSYLPHIEIPQACKFEEHTVGSIVDALVAANEASIEAPFATTRVHLALAYQYLQHTFVETEDNAVY
jgi:hypothetical protein